jgi:hypothetical protein
VNTRAGTIANMTLEQAIALREGGQLEEARALLLELRAAQPDDARIALHTAWVHDSLG